MQARRHERFPFKTYADLQWEGRDGMTRFARAR